MTDKGGGHDGRSRMCQEQPPAGTATRGLDRCHGRTVMVGQQDDCPSPASCASQRKENNNNSHLKNLAARNNDRTSDRMAPPTAVREMPGHASGYRPKETAMQNIREGSKGDEVRAVQSALNLHPLGLKRPLATDGLSDARRRSAKDCPRPSEPFPVAWHSSGYLPVADHRSGPREDRREQDPA